MDSTPQLSAVQRQLALNASLYREALKWVLENRVLFSRGEDRLWYRSENPTSLWIPDHLMPVLSQIALEAELGAEHAG